MQKVYPQPIVSLEKMTNYARECLRDIPHATKMAVSFPFRDRFTHSLRVMRWSERLMHFVPAKRNVVLVAAALHDIGYAVGADGHARHGAAMAQGFLRELGHEEDFVLSVSELIGNHSEKGLLPSQMSNELMVLQDADCLDEIGAVTVLWDCMAEGATDKQSYRKAYERVRASCLSLTGRNRRLKTEYGDRLYRERLGFLKAFVEELEYELFI